MQSLLQILLLILDVAWFIMIARIRNFLPQTGGLDLAPLVALIAVYALRIILINNASAFI